MGPKEQYPQHAYSLTLRRVPVIILATETQQCYMSVSTLQEYCVLHRYILWRLNVVGNNKTHLDPHVGYAVAQLVEAPRYKPEGRGFDSLWCYWNFSLT